MDNIPSIITYKQMLNHKIEVLQKMNSRIMNKYIQIIEIISMFTI